LSQEQVVAAIVIVLLIVFALALPGFATTRNILGLVRSISILGILGLGMGLIVISRSIDLSEIALMACPWGVALIANQHGLPPFWTAVLALVIAVAVGCINGFMVAFVEAPALSSPWRRRSLSTARRTGSRRSTSSMRRRTRMRCYSRAAARCSAYRCRSSSLRLRRWSCTSSCHGPRPAASSMPRATIPKPRSFRASRYDR
jgi:hypothetical protein